MQILYSDALTTARRSINYALRVYVHQPAMLVSVATTVQRASFASACVVPLLCLHFTRSIRPHCPRCVFVLSCRICLMSCRSSAGVVAYVL